MSTEHLITPPKELMLHWWNKVLRIFSGTESADFTIAIPAQERELMYLAYSGGWSEREVTVAAELQQARDGELTACCVWLHKNWRPGSSKDFVIKHLMSDRRVAIHSRPPSLKEQALAAQQRIRDGGSTHADLELVRRVLEALPND